MGKRQRGFAVFESLLFLMLVGIIGFAGWRVYESRENANSIYDKAVINAPREDYSASRVMAVGDIACDPGSIYLNVNDPNHCQSKATAALIPNLKPDAILALGDLQYEDGELDKFKTSYDKDWGVYKSKTYPAPGNHEYSIPWANGYFNYFNEGQNSGRAGENRKGYYAVDVGGWHIIALNSNCQAVGGCAEGSEQHKWLKQNLIENQSSCTLAFWHHPHFSSGRYASDKASAQLSTPFWELLLQYKAEVILNGHDHLYERFALLNTDGSPNNAGIRQFTVGTGGKSHYTQTIKNPGSEKMIDGQFGVLSLDLYAKAYKWRFVAVNGGVLDSGTQKCTS